MIRATRAQREAILRAARDARQRGPVSLKAYDAVDLATDTGNYWWGGLDNRTCNAALRLIQMGLRRGCQA